MGAPHISGVAETASPVTPSLTDGTDPGRDK
ncbi:hypothetical protein BH10PSE9_BH10PSE9_26260 [soil metagenome]